MSVYYFIIYTVFYRTQPAVNINITPKKMSSSSVNNLYIFHVTVPKLKGVHRLLPLSNHNVIIQVLCHVSCEVHMKIVLTLLLPVKSRIARCFTECSEFLCL
jgi:hypothetical protein